MKHINLNKHSNETPEIIRNNQIVAAAIETKHPMIINKTLHLHKHFHTHNNKSITNNIKKIFNNTEIKQDDNIISKFFKGLWMLLVAIIITSIEVIKLIIIGTVLFIKITIHGIKNMAKKQTREERYED